MKTIGKAPGALPVLGHTLPLLRDRLSFAASLPAHGDLVRVRFGPTEAVVICDAELAREAFRDDHLFDKDGPLHVGRESMGNGLIPCPHRDHRRQRALAQPAFHRDRFPAYTRTMVEEFTALARGWREGQEIEVGPALHHVTTRVLVRSMFANAVTGAELDAAVDDIRMLLDGVVIRAVTPKALQRLPIPALRRSTAATNRMRALVADLIAQRRASGIDHGDLLSALVFAGSAEHDGLTETELVDQVVTFFLAGTETVSTMLVWTLHQLGRHPDVEKRMHAEIDEVLGGVRPGLADVPKLELTGRVVAETLRLNPTGWILPRLTTEDVVLGGHPIPKGTTVLISLQAIQHRQDLYPGAGRWDPDRWLERPPNHLAFGAGARKCIGDQYSTTQMVLALAVIGADWRLEHVTGEPVRTAKLDNTEPKLTMRVTERRR